MHRRMLHCSLVASHKSLEIDTAGKVVHYQGHGSLRNDDQLRRPRTMSTRIVNTALQTLMRTSLGLAAAIVLIAHAGRASADELASFATGGYASGLRTESMMHMIDTNKDGMVSQDEWTAFQERSFDALDKNKD